MPMELSGRWEPFAPAHEILVTPQHGFTTDTLLLAVFAAPKKREICADFGAGCGMISLLWALRHAPVKICAVELQEQAVRQLEASVRRNSFEDITILQADIRESRSLFPTEQFDLIACNPPYKAGGAGLQNRDAGRRTARHETTLTLADLAESARYALKFGGRLCLCQRPERLTDAMDTFRRRGLEPKRLRLVQQTKQSRPSLFLLECRKGGRSGLTIEPTLLIEDENGYTPEMLALYGDYRPASSNF